MTAIKRRINYTGRKRIPQSAVAVSMLPLLPNEAPRATASFELGPMEFPPSSSIVLEAYQRSQGMRFELGTIEHPAIPQEFQLDEIDPGESVLFRLKVVESDEQTGRILGAVNRIRPDSRATPDGRRRLFPVEQLDLGQEAWRVRITAAGPVLQLHFGLPQMIAQLQSDPLVQGLILPIALRQVLQVLADGSANDEADEESWRDDWLRYCKESLKLEDDPADLNDEQREEWVDDGASRFARSLKLVDKIKKHEVQSQ
jgi:hypothetical protein